MYFQPLSLPCLVFLYFLINYVLICVDLASYRFEFCEALVFQIFYQSPTSSAFTVPSVHVCMCRLQWQICVLVEGHKIQIRMLFVLYFLWSRTFPVFGCLPCDCFNKGWNIGFPLCACVCHSVLKLNHLFWIPECELLNFMVCGWCQFFVNIYVNDGIDFVHNKN